MSRKTELIPACLYLRASSKEQESSCDQQRKELVPWAKANGYRVVAVYEDTGKSGSKDTKKRVAFHRMIAESYGKKWSAILVWNTSRFGRLNSIQSAEYVKPLIENGCFLHGKSDGVFNWQTTEGRMLWGMLCEANNRQSLALSVDANRGRKDSLERGYWATGKVPFGFDRCYVDGGGTVQNVVKRSVKFTKPKRWHLTLVENKAEADVVRLIFGRFVSESLSYYELARRLNSEGQPCGGEAWTEMMIRYTLKCPAYCGRSMLGTRPGRNQQAHNRIDDAEQRENACPALVDVATWEQAQTIMRNRSASRTKPHSQGAGLLSGFLFCGHCDCRLQKSVSNGRVVYSCMSGRLRPGAEDKGERCQFYQVRENDVLKIVVEHLRTNVDRKLLEVAQTKPEKPAEGSEAILKAKVADLKRKVKNAEESALLAPKAHQAAAWKRVEEWAAELREATHELSQCGNGVDWSEWWEKVRFNLLTLIPAELYGKPLPPELSLVEVEGGIVQQLPDGQTLDWGLMDRKEYPTWKAPLVVSLAEPDKFRGLLRAIGLQVRFKWTKREGTVGKKLGQKRYEVSQTKVTITLQKGLENEGDLQKVLQSNSPNDTHCLTLSFSHPS